VLWLCALPFAVEVLLILGYYWLAYRYTIEFLPLGVWFLAAYLRWAEARTGAARLISPGRFALVVTPSAVATMLSLFRFQSQWWAYPPEYRQKVLLIFEDLDTRLGLGSPMR